MSEAPIYETLSQIFERIFDEDVELKASTTAKDVPGWDSLAHIRLMLAVEKAFNIKISAAETASLKNVGDLVGVIVSRGAA